MTLISLTQAPKKINFRELTEAAYNAYKVMTPRRIFSVLTNPTDNTKIAKSAFPTYSVFLSPADSSGYEVCAWRVNDCTNLCLNCAGKGGLNSVQNARIAKTERLMERPHDWFRSFYHEVNLALKKHGRIAMRMNGTSDLPWEHILPLDFFVANADKIVFYDYTKSFARARNQDAHFFDLTFSYSGENLRDCLYLLDNQLARVAVVFDTKRGKPLPATWRGFEVIDGDLYDSRWHDPKGVVVGLRYKPVMRDGKWLRASDFVSDFVQRA